MFKFDDPLGSAAALATDLAERVITTIKKGDLATTSSLHTDLTLLQAAIEQLVKEKK